MRTETNLVPCFLLIVVQRVQVPDARRMKELVINIGVTGTVPAVSTHTAHLICRENTTQSYIRQIVYFMRKEKNPLKVNAR